MKGRAVRHNFERGPPKDYTSQIRFSSFRGEDLNAKVYDVRQMPSDDKRSHGLWPGELKTYHRAFITTYWVSEKHVIKSSTVEYKSSKSSNWTCGATSITGTSWIPTSLQYSARSIISLEIKKIKIKNILYSWTHKFIGWYASCTIQLTNTRHTGLNYLILYLIQSNLP